MLADVQCKNALCPADKKRLRLTDAGGLYLEVSSAGSKGWFWKTYQDGKEGRMALGSYPAVSVAAARKARDAVQGGQGDVAPDFKVRDDALPVAILGDQPDACGNSGPC